jgi:hypothetical protein
MQVIHHSLSNCRLFHGYSGFLYFPPNKTKFASASRKATCTPSIRHDSTIPSDIGTEWKWNYVHIFPAESTRTYSYAFNTLRADYRVFDVSSAFISLVALMRLPRREHHDLRIIVIWDASFTSNRGSIHSKTFTF